MKLQISIRSDELPKKKVMCRILHFAQAHSDMGQRRVLMCGCGHDIRRRDVPGEVMKLIVSLPMQAHRGEDL